MNQTLSERSGSRVKHCCGLNVPYLSGRRLSVKVSCSIRSTVAIQIKLTFSMWAGFFFVLYRLNSKAVWHTGIHVVALWVSWGQPDCFYITWGCQVIISRYYSPVNFCSSEGRSENHILIWSCWTQSTFPRTLNGIWHHLADTHNLSLGLRAI